MILISVELVLNAVDINFAAFNRYLFPDQMEGMFLRVVRHRHRCVRNRRSHRHHHQCLPEFRQRGVDNIQQMKE